ncbi:MAG: MBL fold metallo-hydrolase [Candidatus Bathyarchaeota archaeon]|jgi:glyoxylase-like metal-dependent hydrolase (beta-lactamase superfamily II)|nr:MBL fold metallo-hydrolase [Candidatus Bathyarchaeota archaeon]
MSPTKIGEQIYLIDVQTGGIKNFIASYVLKGKQVAIIETGPTSSVPNLLSGLKELNVKPEDVAYVAVSHIHLDHGGGVGTLLKFLPKAKVIVHQRGAPHLANPEKLWQQSQDVLKGIVEIYGEPEPVPEERIIATTDGMTFDVGDNIRLRVVETLGHASHHQSYYEPSSESLFPGDAAGIYLSEIDAIVPTTPSPFRLDIALASLDKLMSLKPKTLYYTHFGRASNPLEKLQAYSQQLNLWAKIVKQGLENKENLKMISERIIKSDRAVQRAFEHIQVHPVLSQTVFNESLRGFIDFVEKFGLNPP